MRDSCCCIDCIHCKKGGGVFYCESKRISISFASLDIPHGCLMFRSMFIGKKTLEKEEKDGTDHEVQ